MLMRMVAGSSASAGIARGRGTFGERSERVGERPKHQTR